MNLFQHATMADSTGEHGSVHAVLCSLADTGQQIAVEVGRTVFGVESIGAITVFVASVAERSAAIFAEEMDPSARAGPAHLQVFRR